jgi:hypothetical protein
VSVSLLAACSSGDDDDAKGKPAAAGTPAPATSAGAQAGSVATDAPSSAALTPAGADLGQPVASGQAGQGKWSLKVEVYPLKRSDRSISANLRITAVSGPGNDRFQVSGLLSDGNYESVDFGGHAADGVQLIDGVNAKAHLPASDGKGQCFCSRDLSGAFIAVGGSQVISAVYAAPPADVRSMAVVVPKFGTFANVPIQ